MMQWRALVCASGLFLVLTSVLAGCGPNTPVAETPPPPVTVSQPLVRKVTDFDEYEGQIKAAMRDDVRARVQGHLTKVNFQNGQMVKKDDLLYEIDDRTYKTALDAAKAQQKAAEASLQFAKAEYNRTRYLVSKGAETRETLESWVAKEAVAKGDVLKAQEAVKKAQLDVNFTLVKAPFAGMIGRTQVDLGNLINAGGGETLLATIVTVDPMRVYFNVDERSLLRYKRDRLGRKDAVKGVPIKELRIPVDVALEGEKGFPHQGLIEFAGNQVNPSTGTFEVYGVLPNPDLFLVDGMRARVRVPVSEPHEAILVTERVVGNDQGRKYVYVVNDQDTVERRDVVPGRVHDGLLVIREGLKPDEWLIVNGIQRVRDGMKVQPKRGPMPGAPRPAEAAQTTPKS